MLVDWSLREIGELFESHGFEKLFVLEEELPGGQRRNAVEHYYQSVGWTDPDHVVRMLRAYEDVLFSITDSSLPYRADLLRYLDRDGFALDGNRLVAKSKSSGFDPAFVASLNSQHLAEHIQRIERSLADDPAQAIGSAKELLESTLKTILDRLEIGHGTEDVPKLLKSGQPAS